MRSWLAAVAIMLVASGCLDEGSPPESPQKEAEMVSTLAVPAETCGSCAEPTVAWMPDGRLFVVSHFASFEEDGGLSVSEDGGRTFYRVPGPPEIRSPASLAGLVRGDILVQSDPQGRLWWTAIQLESNNNGAVQVARSDDGGSTWAINQRVPMAGQGLASPSDRQWLAFGDDPDTVFLVCTCPFLALPQLAVSHDSGASFSEPRPVTSAAVRPSPVGRPSYGAGVLIIPHLTGAPTAFPTWGVAVSLTADEGRSFRSIDLAGPGSTGIQRFPNSAWQDGTFAVAWRMTSATAETAGSYSAMLALSSDVGATWSEPQAWSGDLNVPGIHPWVEPLGDDRWAVVFFASHDGHRSLHAAIGSGDGPVVTHEIARMDSENTDFPHASRGPDGSLAIPWSNDQGLWVTVLPPAMLS